MDESSMFVELFRATTTHLLWAAEQVPDERRFLRPPFPNADWSSAQEIFHLGLYERSVALPSMRLWLGDSVIDVEAFSDEEKLWAAEGQHTSYSTLLQRLSDVRDEQIALLPALTGQWAETRETIWSNPALPPVTLRWVVSKTLQHSAEHTSAISQLTLFWDLALHHLATQASAEA